MRKLVRAANACALAAAICLSSCPLPVHAESESAVLILAPGGTPAWTKSVKKAVKEAQLPYPYRIFCGMGDNAAEQRELQDMITSLEDSGAHAIYVVPLLVSSYSEICRQWK